MNLQAIPGLHEYLPYLLLTLLVWITYCYTLKCLFVSDDHQGLGEYDGKLQGFEYGMLSRWVRYHLMGGQLSSGEKLQDDKVIPLGKIPWRHHALSVVVFNLAVLALFPFLSNILGANLALLSLCLFVVHPVATQAIAWISGLGYPLSLLWMALTLNFLYWFHTIPDPSVGLTLFVFLSFIVICFLMINALFIGLCLWPVLVLMGYYPFAALALVISVGMGLRIVQATIKLRVDAFKDQNMAQSTKPKIRKIIVAFKTFLYYVRMVLWPSKMGLYHEWGYHYEDTLEKEDWRFIGGLISVGLVVFWFFVTPVFAIKFGLLWFCSFIFIFLNWITIQQFVTERYVFVPSLGVCIIVAYFTQNYLPIYGLILGLALMRTWMHLPTYDNELRFYQSNIWNFPKSEIAYGNLGVTYLRLGMVGTALDHWNVGVKLNPDYDVPYYNISSHFKSNGIVHLHHGRFNEAISFLTNARDFLDKATKCKICHFRETWLKELEEIDNMIKNPQTVIYNEYKRLQELLVSLNKMMSEAKTDTRKKEVLSSISDAETQVKQTKLLLERLPQPPLQDNVLTYLRNSLKT